MKKSKTVINNMFIIGAGFTQAVFPKAPLNANLLRCILENNPKTLLRRYKIRYQTDDIEILLTRMDLEAEELQSERLRRDREIINHDLAKYFEQFRFRSQILENKKWLEDFANKLFQPNDAIITTNYDCFLEGLLDYYKLWSPMGGYVNVSNRDEDLPENPKNILIYKIHGSENFWVAPVINNKDKEFIGLIINENIFPHSGKNISIEYGGGQPETRSYIIAPSFVKFPHVQIADTVNKAIAVAISAKNLVIGGCGLREEDNFLWLILTSFINNQIQTPQKLIIIDPKKAREIEKRIINYGISRTKRLNIRSIPKTFQDGIEQLLREL